MIDRLILELAEMAKAVITGQLNIIQEKIKQRVDYRETYFERNFVTASRAATEFLLKPSQLEDLVKTERRSPYENDVTIMVYHRKDVQERAIKVWGSLENLEKELKKREQVKKVVEQYMYETKRSAREARRYEDIQFPFRNRKGNKVQFAVVVMAITIDFVNFLFKLIVWVVTRSESMLAETFHALGDFINQFILVIGILQLRQRATEKHPYGYNNIMYVTSLISGTGILYFGCIVSCYRGIRNLIQKDSDFKNFEDLSWAFLALTFSLFTESVTLLYSFYMTVKSSKRATIKFFTYLYREADPAVNLVLMEDVVAFLGSGIAMVLLWISKITYSHTPDSIGSVVIGILIGIVSLFLIITNSAALVGRSIRRKRTDAINRKLESDVMIRAIYDVKAMDIGSNLVRYKAEIDFDGAQLTRVYLDRLNLEELLKDLRNIKNIDELETFMVAHGEAIVDLLGGEIDRIELKVKDEFPEIRHMDLELL